MLGRIVEYSFILIFTKLIRDDKFWWVLLMFLRLSAHYFVINLHFIVLYSLTHKYKIIKEKVLFIL